MRLVEDGAQGMEVDSKGNGWFMSDKRPDYKLGGHWMGRWRGMYILY